MQLPNLLPVQLVGRRASAMLLMRRVLQVRRGPHAFNGKRVFTGRLPTILNMAILPRCACVPALPVPYAPKKTLLHDASFRGGASLLEAHQNPRRPCSRCSVANPIGWMTDDVRSVLCVRGSQRELGRYGRRSAGSPTARQRNVTSIVSVSISLFSLSSKLLLLFRTRSCLESRAHCWFAAERAASLADAAPPCGVRADTV